MKVEKLTLDASIEFGDFGMADIKKPTKRKSDEEMREACAHNPTTKCIYDKNSKSVVATLKYANQLLKQNDKKYFVKARNVDWDVFKANEKALNQALREEVLSGKYDDEIRRISNEMSEARLKQHANA